MAMRSMQWANFSSSQCKPEPMPTIASSRRVACARRNCFWIGARDLLLRLNTCRLDRVGSRLDLRAEECNGLCNVAVVRKIAVTLHYRRNIRFLKRRADRQIEFLDDEVGRLSRREEHAPGANGLEIRKHA